MRCGGWDCKPKVWPCKRGPGMPSEGSRKVGNWWCWGPYCIQRTKATWFLNISHHSNNDHRRSLNNCNSFTCSLCNVPELESDHLEYWCKRSTIQEPSGHLGQIKAVQVCPSLSYGSTRILFFSASHRTTQTLWRQVLRKWQKEPILPPSINFVKTTLT